MSFERRFGGVTGENVARQRPKIRGKASRIYATNVTPSETGGAATAPLITAKVYRIRRFRERQFASEE
jgi:hypothetical protein